MMMWKQMQQQQRVAYASHGAPPSLSGLPPAWLVIMGLILAGCAAGTVMLQLCSISCTNYCDQTPSPTPNMTIAECNTDCLENHCPLSQYERSPVYPLTGLVLTSIPPSPVP